MELCLENIINAMNKICMVVVGGWVRLRETQAHIREMAHEWAGGRYVFAPPQSLPAPGVWGAGR